MAFEHQSSFHYCPLNSEEVNAVRFKRIFLELITKAKLSIS